ncbi:MAG: APC family permease [Acidilobaceae archaeon]
MGLAKLNSAALSLKENYAQAMAVTAPLGSVVSTTTVAVAYAGGDIVLATLLAFIASAMWVYTLTIYSRKLASPGGYYTFVYAAFRNRTLAFSEAIIELFSFILLNAVNVIAVYLMTSTILRSYGLSELSPLLLPLVLLFSLLYPTVVSFATNIQRLLSSIVLVVATLEVLVLFALFAISLMQGVKPEFLLPPFEASLGSIALAFMIILVSLDGVGTATYLGEETRSPTNNVTRGMWLAFILGGLSMVLGTYAMVALWPFGLAALSESEQPLIELVAMYGPLPAFLVFLIATKSLLVSNVGTTLAAARILFNLARENAAPSFLQATNAHRQPHYATLLVGLLTVAITFGFAEAFGYREAFVHLGVATGILWIVGRAINSAGAPFLVVQMSRLVLPPARDVLVPLAATALNLGGLAISAMDMTPASTALLGGIGALAAVWYFFLGRFGVPGELVVDESNNVIKLDEYLSSLSRGEKTV